MSSCCGNPNTPARTRTVVEAPCNVANLCDEPCQSSWTEDRLASIPVTDRLQLTGKNGRGHYALAANFDGIIVAEGGRHKVTRAPRLKLPPLRKFIETDTPGIVEATPEGLPIEVTPPGVGWIIVQDNSGAWYAYRGPTEQRAVMMWTGFNWELEATNDGKIRGPIGLVDNLILFGSAGSASCNEYEDIKKLDPRIDGFVISDGQAHRMLSCDDGRPAQDAELKVFALAACTNKGPVMVPVPEVGVIVMCNGNLIPLDSPVYTSRDQADGKIPAGKSVGNFIVGASLETNDSGCLQWKLPSMTTVTTGGQSLKLVFGFTNTEQYATAPPWATKVSLKVWGAPGSNDDTARGGTGGYTTGVFPCAGGDQFAIVVGQGPVYNGLGPRAPYVFGYGGVESADSHQEAGGGLSGVFTGTAPVTITSDARALAIAGGGGAGGATGPNQNLTLGGNGNAANAGGMPNFQGNNGSNGRTNGVGCGGGGYRGGAGVALAGRGGSGYLAPTKISGEIVASSDASAPGGSDPDYGDSAAIIGGHGRIVVEFLT